MMNEEERTGRGEFWDYRPKNKRHKPRQPKEPNKPKPRPPKKLKTPLQEQLGKLIERDVIRKHKASLLRARVEILQMNGTDAERALDIATEELKRRYAGTRIKTAEGKYAIFSRLLNTAINAIDFYQVARNVLMAADDDTSNDSRSALPSKK